MRRRSRLVIKLFLVAGATCFSAVSCLPSTDQLRSIVQGSIISAIQLAITDAVYLVIPPTTTTTTTTT